MKKRKKENRKCRICDKDIITWKESIPSSKGIAEQRGNFTDSNEGTYFSITGRSGVWFCNSCWKKILKYKKCKLKK